MRIHVRARATRVANGIDDRVFGFQRDELGVAQLFVAALRAHRERRSLLDERGPRKSAHATVERIVVGRVDAPEHHGQPRDEPRFQTSREDVLALREEGDAAGQGPHAPRARRTQVLGDELLHAREAAGEELALIRSIHVAPYRVPHTHHAPTSARRAPAPTS